MARGNSGGHGASGTGADSTVGVAASYMNPNVRLVVGGQFLLKLHLLDSGKNPIHAHVTYSSSNSAVARVHGDGMVLGIAAGTAVITATAKGQSATSTITVV